MLNRIKIGWSWLEQTLNRMIDEVNLNKPLSSASITIEQSPNGTILRVAGKGDDSQKQPSSQQQPKQPSVVWQNVGWVTVTIVDPSTCAQSNLTVVAQKQGSSIRIQ